MPGLGSNWIRPMIECSACGVNIEGDVVHFSHGKPGTRERLHARVCQYSKRPGCINTGVDTERLIKDDFYGE